MGAYTNDYGMLTICDLPGLISGAAEGTGLGKSVLRHLKNTKYIIYLIDPTNEKYDINLQISMLESELIKYDENYQSIDKTIVINKSDKLKAPNDDYLNIS